MHNCFVHSFSFEKADILWQLKKFNKKKMIGYSVKKQKLTEQSTPVYTQYIPLMKTFLAADYSTSRRLFKIQPCMFYNPFFSITYKDV